jgi:hypothetical protein
MTRAQKYRFNSLQMSNGARAPVPRQPRGQIEKAAKLLDIPLERQNRISVRKISKGERASRGNL